MEYALPVIVIFLLGMTVLGAWHARKIRSAEDFALAGRGLGVPVLAGTLIATWIGTGSIFGNAEKAYRIGMWGFFLPVSGLIGILVLAWLAPKARAISADSLPQMLGKPFGKATQKLGGLAILLAYLIIVSYQYRAGAAVAGRLFPDLDTVISIPIGSGEGFQFDLLPAAFAVFVILYTALAGLVSVALTDVVNGIVMSAGVILALFFLWGKWEPTQMAEGVAPLTETQQSWHGGLSAPAWINFLLPTFLLILGDANLYQRFLSARSPAAARTSAIVAFFGLLLLECGIIALALAGRLQLSEPLENPGHVIVAMAFQLVPPFVGILLCATIVAVVVSTADSFLLACSTTASTDLGRGMTTPNRQRLLVVVFGIVALGLAFTSDEFFGVAIYAYTLYGASLTPAVLCALLWPNTPGRAVLGGMIAGLSVAIGWKLLSSLQVGEGDEAVSWMEHWFGSAITDWDPVLPALAANLLMLLLLSRGGRKAVAD